MPDNDLLAHWRKIYDAPDADNAAVLAETEARFLQQTPFGRKQFVDGLEQGLLAEDVGLKERASASVCIADSAPCMRG